MPATSTGPTLEGRAAAGIANDAPVMLVRIEADGTCTWANDAWRDFATRDHAERDRSEWLDVFEAHDAPGLEDRVRTDREFEYEARIARAGERTRVVHLRGRPVRHPDGSFAGHVVAAFDVTEWRAAERVLQFLSVLGDVLARSIDADAMLHDVARILVPELADACTIALVDDDERIRRVAAKHSDEVAERELRALSPTVDADDKRSAIAEVVRTGVSLYRPIVDAPGPDEPWPAPGDLDVPRSLLCVPLHGRDRVIGAIALMSSRRRLVPNDVELAREIARRCAAAVDAAALFRRSEDARARLALLASIGEQLAATLDVRGTLRALVRRIVPVFADVAVVALRRSDGSLQRAEIAHVDAAVEAAFREDFFPRIVDADDPTPLARAARTRKPMLIEDFAAELANGAHAKRASAYDAARTIGASSVLAVPLLSGDDVMAVLVLAFTHSGRRYRSGDVPLALDIARRAAIAFERARAFDQERRVAETLQHAMLPDELPDVPGIAFCARYVPGGRVDIGGDWYDVIELPHGRFGVAIGDVAGHGLSAAAVMGRLRNVLRAFASEGSEPGSVLRRVNRFVFEQGPLDMATLCYGILDSRTGRLAWSLAGHPPPLLLRPGAPPEFGDGRPSPPIGADLQTDFQTAEAELGPGTTVLFYTDGLVERRGESLDLGLDRLRERLRYTPPLLEETCDLVLEQMLGGGRPQDDVAVLGLRFVGIEGSPVRIRRPARPAELGPVRRLITAWLEAAGVAGEEVGAAAVAVTEAATNAIEHAYGPGEGWFEVEADIRDGVLHLAVRDEGRWRPKARGGGGRGLTLISRLMDEFEVRRRRDGTEVWMRRMLHGPAGEEH